LLYKGEIDIIILQQVLNFQEITFAMLLHFSSVTVIFFVTLIFVCNVFVLLLLFILMLNFQEKCFLEFFCKNRKFSE